MLPRRALALGTASCRGQLLRAPALPRVQLPAGALARSWHSTEIEVGSGLLLAQRRRCASASVSQPTDEVLVQWRELPLEERKKLLETMVEESEVEIGGTASVSRAQLNKLFVATAIPMIGFGFMDNAVMIFCGEMIEVNIGATLCISTLCAAGLGNLVSDIVGLGTGGVIEAGASRLGFEAPPLSGSQLATRAATRTRHAGSVLGLGLGCILGMFPLFFHDEEDMRLRKIFRRYDTNNDGELDWNEIKSAFNDAKMYPTEFDKQYLFGKYDIDKDGGISYPEFKKMIEDLEATLKDNADLDARRVIASTALFLEMESGSHKTDDNA